MTPLSKEQFAEIDDFFQKDVMALYMGEFCYDRWRAKFSPPQTYSLVSREASPLKGLTYREVLLNLDNMVKKKEIISMTITKE